MFDPIDIIKLANDLGIIQTVRDKLTTQKDPAAEKLADVLDELAKGVCSLKDLATGEQREVPAASVSAEVRRLLPV